MGKGKPPPTHNLNAPRRNCTCTNRAPDESVSPKPNTRPYSRPAKVLDANPSRSYYDRRMLCSSLRSSDHTCTRECPAMKNIVGYLKPSHLAITGLLFFAAIIT